MKIKADRGPAVRPAAGADADAESRVRKVPSSSRLESFDEMPARRKEGQGGAFSEPHDYKASKPLLDPLFKDEVGYLIRMIRMREIYAIELLLEPLGLTLSAWYPLAVLRVQDGMSQRELGLRLNLKDAAIGKAIDALERTGLVERRKDSGDRRKALIFLTAEGKKVVIKVAKMQEKFRSSITNGFSKAEQQALHGMLERVFENIEELISATASAKSGQ
jgi:DNA-binding MarR family transcriptional regulator